MEVIQYLQSYQTDSLTTFFKFITFLGNWEFYLFGMPILYWLFNKEKVIKLFFIVFPAALIITYLKQLFHTSRPVGVVLIEQTGYSFPSAHAASATVLFLMIAILIKNKWMYVLSVAMILLISISRIYLGVHFPIDVIGGILIGLTLVLFYELFLYQFIHNWFSNKSNIYKTIALIVITVIVIVINKMNTYYMSIMFGLGIGLIFIDKDGSTQIKNSFQKLLTIIVGIVVIYFLWLGIMNGLIPMTYISTFIVFSIYGIFIIGLPKVFSQLKL